jgi:hypothetical protein
LKQLIFFLAAVPGHRFCRGNFREERAILIQDGRSECQHLGTFYERYSVRSWSSFLTCFFFFIAGFASRTRLFFPILSFQLRWSFKITNASSVFLLKRTLGLHLTGACSWTDFGSIATQQLRRVERFLLRSL